MKLRVTAFYPPGSDFSRLENEPPEKSIIQSAEMNFDAAYFSSKFEILTEYESRTNLTIDQGEDGDCYELTITEIFDSETQARSKCQMVYDHAMELLQG